MKQKRIYNQDGNTALVADPAKNGGTSSYLNFHNNNTNLSTPCAVKLHVISKVKDELVIRYGQQLVQIIML